MRFAAGKLAGSPGHCDYAQASGNHGSLQKSPFLEAVLPLKAAPPSEAAPAAACLKGCSDRWPGLPSTAPAPYALLLMSIVAVA